MSNQDPSDPPGTASPPLGEAISTFVGRFLFGGRREIGRAARRSRLRLEVRQLDKDREHFWMRLGKTAYHLVAAGELDHPALRKAIARIDEIDARIGALQARIEADED